MMLPNLHYQLVSQLKHIYVVLLVTNESQMLCRNYV